MWKLLGDAAMGINEVCECDPGFQLLMTRNELDVCGGVLYIRQTFCMFTSAACYKCGKYKPNTNCYITPFSNSSCWGTNERLSANAIHKLTLNTDKRTY